MSCRDCVFKGIFQDMGASCNVCNLQTGLADAIKACENSGECRHRFTVSEAKKIVMEREGGMPIIAREQSAQIEQSDIQTEFKDAIARVAEAAQMAFNAMKKAVAGIRVAEETIKNFDQIVKENAGDHGRE